MANVTGLDLLIGDRLARHFPALPPDIATCMYYTGIDPFTKKPVHVSKALKDRKLQRALLQFFKPENWFEVRQALIEAGRQDLIGGCEGLIPPSPPPEALKARRERAGQEARGEYVHTIENPVKKGKGYRPHRKSAQRHGRLEN